MANVNSTPLTANDLKEMNDQLEALRQADEIADRALRAGIDVGPQKAKAQELRTQIIRIKQQFFPGK